MIIRGLVGLAMIQLSLAEEAKKPNFLIISIDDLNDWVEGFGGHPQAVTPNIARLADQGIRFENAHCQAPVCNPSRASLGLSLYPSTTGIYFLDPDFSKSEEAGEVTVFPKTFANHGYAVSAAGKIFHGNTNKQHFPNWAGNFGGMGPLPEKKLTGFLGHPLWDWGAYPEKEEQTPDYQIASWAEQALRNASEKQPFMIATGFFRPHVPQYAPQKWLDLFPLESIKLPKTPPNDDLKDISAYAKDLKTLHHVAPTHDWVTENDEWKRLVQTYLASVAFVDHQVGKVLDAVSEANVPNTYIILFSDHGFHLGEKKHWAKRTLWEDGTRVPLIIAGPGIRRGIASSEPVGLIDLYPTMLDLAGLEIPDALEGHSLRPLWETHSKPWEHMARTEFGPGNYALRSKRYRYIHFVDGSEEFYDHATDPHEWHNLIHEPKLAEEIERHRQHRPTSHHPVLGKQSTGHQAFQAAGEGLGGLE